MTRRTRKRTTKRGENLIRRAAGLIDRAAGQVSEDDETRAVFARVTADLSLLLDRVASERSG